MHLLRPELPELLVPQVLLAQPEPLQVLLVPPLELLPVQPPAE